MKSSNVNEVARDKTWLQKKFLDHPYRVISGLFSLFIVFSLFFATPREIIQGLWTITISTDILVSDYIAIGGLGAAIVNSALSGILCLVVLKLAKHEPEGLTFGTFGLVLGFAFFGKNPANMMPIIFGGYLYSRVTKTPFKSACLPPILVTCLAPVVTQLAFVEHIPTPIGIGIGILLGIFVGFVITPIAKSVRQTHDGYNLYNVGLAGGLLAIGIMVAFRTLGIDFGLMNIWSEGYNFQLGLFLFLVSAYFILCGLLSAGKESFLDMLIMRAENVDYYLKYGPRSYMNMGILGLSCFFFMLLLRGEYSGPIIGAILSVVGFGVYGKRLFAAIPIMTGCMLAALGAMVLAGIPFNAPGFLVAAIFSTCLCPLSTKFGWKWGIVVGFMHLTFAANVAIFHGGMNLYNNGLAGGLAVLLLLPVIRMVNSVRGIQVE